ncbi:hypothetical protein [Methylobacterium sp. P1-11]|uniref:hypothetical protein n=1 Tax=Methylobacterium sp. P1-11 TaxID=2024616 RepID=UPI0018D5AC3D|nr:hypothetical protein [Methylobacterium sp. P1-11]
MGWTAEQLFGVHPEYSFLRVEYAGALMVNASPAVGVEPDRIVFERFSGCRTKPGQTWGPIKAALQLSRGVSPTRAYRVMPMNMLGGSIRHDRPA